MPRTGDGRAGSVAIRPTEPGVDVVAVLLPVAGLQRLPELDPVDPLDALVPVHLAASRAGRGRRAAGRAACRPSRRRASRRAAAPAGASASPRRAPRPRRSGATETPFSAPACSSTSAIRTPAQRTFFTTQPVTQWKSETCSARGIALRSASVKVLRRRDEAVDAKPVGGRRDVRHRRADRVDAPAARRHDRRHRLRHGAAEQPGDVPGEKEPDGTGPEDPEEAGPPDRAIVHPLNLSSISSSPFSRRFMVPDVVAAQLLIVSV